MASNAETGWAAPLPTNPVSRADLAFGLSWGDRGFRVNARFSVAEIDHLLATQPAWQRRHSSLPARRSASVGKACVDKDPLDAAGRSPVRSDLRSYRSFSHLHNAHPCRPKGVVVSHANSLAYRPHQCTGCQARRRRAPARGPIFHIWICIHIRGCGVLHLPDHDPEIQPGQLLRDRVTRAASSAPCVPHDQSWLTTFAELSSST